MFSVFSSMSVACCYWTDLREITNSVPGTWIWGDGSPLSYDQWTPGQPSHVSDVRAPLYKLNTLLYDEESDRLYTFVCQK